MKRLLLILMLAPLFLFGQNGGQSAENNVVRAEFVGHTTLDYYKVTSKQNCIADYRVSYENVLDSVITLPPLGNTTIGVVHINGGIFKAKAVQGTTCTQQPDMGWVEVTSGLILALGDGNKLKPTLRSKGITVFPTVIQDYFTLKIGRDIKRPVRIELHSMTGVQMNYWCAFAEEVRVETKSFPPGSYILSIYNGNMMMLGTQILIKQ